jgi:AcrR family transcriptional regulator
MAEVVAEVDGFGERQRGDRPGERRPRVDEAALAREVVDTAIELVRERGPDVTVEEIGDRAGVSRRRFYQLFPTKHDLHLAMFTEVNARAVAARRVVVDTSGGTSAQRLRRCLLHAFDPTWNSDPFLRSIAQLEARAVARRADGLTRAAQPWIDYVGELVRACRADGFVTVDIPDDRIATHLQLAIRIRLVRDRLSESTEGLAAEPDPTELVTLLLAGALGTADLSDPEPPATPPG